MGRHYRPRYRITGDPTNTVVYVIVILSVAFLLSATFFYTSQRIYELYDGYQGSSSSWIEEAIYRSSDYMMAYLRWFLCGLFLPLSLMVIVSNSKRRGLSAIFIVLSLLFVSAQFFASPLTLIIQYDFLDYDTLIYKLIRVFSSIPGSNVLDVFIKVLYEDHLSQMELLSAKMYSYADLLYILPNILSGVGFIIIAASKKIPQQSFDKRISLQ